jgi:hypothetical protein
MSAWEIIGNVLEIISIHHHCADPSDRAVCGRLVAWIAGSNSARSMDACFVFIQYVVLSCVGRGFCDGLITRPEESYRVSSCV